MEQIIIVNMGINKNKGVKINLSNNKVIEMIGGIPNRREIKMWEYFKESMINRIWCRCVTAIIIMDKKHLKMDFKI